MKKQVYFWFAIILGVFVMGGCYLSLNDTEKKVVGKWHYVVSVPIVDAQEQFGEDSYIKELGMQIEAYCNYATDHTSKDNGQIEFLFHVIDYEDEEDYYYEEWIDLIYDVQFESTWRVEDNRLIEKANKSDISFSHFETASEYDPDSDDYYINELKSIVQDILPAFRHEALKESESVIEEISNDEMILNEGEESVSYVRVE